LDLVVNKKDRRHFAVKTPYLAAVVKGTTFTVDVRQGKAHVRVTSGKVGVSSHVSGESVDIVRGQTAGIDVSQPQTARLSVRAQPGAPKAAKIKKSKKLKKAKPNFYTNVKVDGKKRQLATGASSKMLSRAEQAQAVAERKKSIFSSSRKSHRSDSRGRQHQQSQNRDRGRDVDYDQRKGIQGNPNNGHGASGGAPGNSGNAPEQSGSAPGNSGNAPGQSGSAPGNSGNAPGQSGDAPGNSGNAPGHNK
ncbi:MAG: FecR domain-containing protein, partial [Porticoccaceae bacterium]|nr:FecR domain-containing protein [Porticoccaceae bacterium]